MTTRPTPADRGRVGLITGATQGLGLALVAGLASRWTSEDTVYLTGRSADRVRTAVHALSVAGARIRGVPLDVTDSDAVRTVADQIQRNHGGIDVVFNNAVMRVGPEDDPRDVVDEYADVNNFGTTRILRAFGPVLRDHGRLIVVASSLGTLEYLAPVLHSRFDDLVDLDAVDDAVEAWRDAVADGSARGQAWPGFVNIPSKIAQVAAVRTVARQRRKSDASRDVFIAAVCPGMINTPTSAVWWDVSSAPDPDHAARPLLDLVLGPSNSTLYGELIRDGVVLPWITR